MKIELMNYKLKQTNMKTSVLKKNLVLLLISTSTFVFAQPGGNKPASDKKEKQAEKRENIEAQRVAFITQELNLTPEEAQKFWPVYNQYTEKLQESRKKRRQEMKDSKENIDEMSDKEVEKLVDEEIIERQKELDLQKEYHSKFKAILPIKKVAKLYRAEDKFKRVLLNKLKDKEHPHK